MSAFHCGFWRGFRGPAVGPQGPRLGPRRHKRAKEGGRREVGRRKEEGGASFFLFFQKRPPRRFHRRHPPPSVGSGPGRLPLAAPAGTGDDPELPRWRRDNRDSRKWASANGSERKHRGVGVSGRLQGAGTTTRLAPYVQSGSDRSGPVRSSTVQSGRASPVSRANELGSVAG